ncbi:MAG: hypothetical protein ACRBEQ_06270 [Hyphomonas sp.]
MIDQMLAPWRSSLSLTAAALETMLVAQKNMLGAGGMMSMDENRMREMFHSAADANLRRWGEVAENLSNVPDVYHQMSRVPGSVLTDFFDKAQRAAK